MKQDKLFKIIKKAIVLRRYMLIAERSLKNKLSYYAFDKSTPTLEVFEKVDSINSSLTALCNLKVITDIAIKAYRLNPTRSAMVQAVRDLGYGYERMESEFSDIFGLLERARTTAKQQSARLKQIQAERKDKLIKVIQDDEGADLPKTACSIFNRCGLIKDNIELAENSNSVKISKEGETAENIHIITG